MTSRVNQPDLFFLSIRGNESSDQKHKVKPSSLDFILLPHKEAVAEPNNELPISTELVKYLVKHIFIFLGPLTDSLY